MTNEINNHQLNLLLKQIESGSSKFQVKNFILLLFPIFLIGSFTMSYVFTAGNLEYRCRLFQCDQEPFQYNSIWTSDAIPFRNSKYSKCKFYAFRNDSDGNCSKEAFDKTEEFTCYSFIYRDNELTIVNEFNIYCEENEWKLSLVGTVNCLGILLFTFWAGYFSDRFGRKTIMIIGLMCCAIFGELRSFSNNYWMFLLTEFLEASLGVTAHTSIYILIMEAMPVDKRVLAGTIIGMVNALGAVYLGILANLTRNFRTLLRILYFPTVLIISYYWLVSESVQWLITKKRYDAVLGMIVNVIKVDDAKICSDLIAPLNNGNSSVDTNCNSMLNNNKDPFQLLKKSQKRMIVVLFCEQFLLVRLVICAFCWLSIVFTYFGLNLTSVTLSGDKYVNFILISLVEIPGYLFCYVILSRVGRKLSTCGALTISGLACILSQCLPIGLLTLRLILFLIGKCFISFSFAAIYLYTVELFPTSMRNTLLSVCSMAGQIGAIVAQFTPLLSHVMPGAQFLLFGGLTIVSGLLILKLPETLNLKLPNTVEEAKNLS